MVVIHVKRTETDQFLYETTCDTSNDNLIRHLVKISNTRIRVVSLVDALKNLAQHGPSKHPNKCGIDEILEKGGEIIEKGEFYCPDPLGNRTGNAPSPQLRETMERVGQDALDAISNALVQRKIPLALEVLKEKIDNIRGAVTMAYPMKLPEYDPVFILLDDASYSEALGGTQSGQELMDEETAQLWWAGKEFFRNELVSDRIGKNEKTKIIAKLHKQGAGAPQREPAVSEEERKTMMAHYFKKQEEMKKMAEADDDDYLTSSWANPSAMKNQLRGTSSIRPF